MVRRLEPYERWLQFDRCTTGPSADHGHDQPWDRWRDHRLVRPEQQHRPGDEVGDVGSRSQSRLYFWHNGRSGGDKMEFLFGLFATTGFNPTIAVRGTDLLSVPGVPDAGRKSGGHKLQH